MADSEATSKHRLIGSLVLAALLFLTVIWMVWPPAPELDSEIVQPLEIEAPVFVPPDIADVEPLHEEAPLDPKMQSPSVEPSARDIALNQQSKPEPESLTQIVVDTGTKTKSESISPKVLKSAWVVQVGTFSDHANAAKLHERLLAAKYPAFLEPASVSPGKNATRVRVGPFPSKPEADRARESLLKGLKLNGFVKQVEN